MFKPCWLFQVLISDKEDKSAYRERKLASHTLPRNWNSTGNYKAVASDKKTDIQPIFQAASEYLNQLIARAGNLTLAVDEEFTP